jgi:hypothetical protein
MVSMKMYGECVETAEQELYTAIEALERGDLTFARSSAARAQTAIVDAWRSRNHEVMNETKTVLD